MAKTKAKIYQEIDEIKENLRKLNEAIENIADREAVKLLKEKIEILENDKAKLEQMLKNKEKDKEKDKPKTKSKRISIVDFLFKDPEEW